MLCWGMSCWGVSCWWLLYVEGNSVGGYRVESYRVGIINVEGHSVGECDIGGYYEARVYVSNVLMGSIYQWIKRMLLWTDRTMERKD